MRHWERTKLALLCGGCGIHLPKNSPIQVIELEGVKKKKFRGPCCATEATPDDLPDAPTDAQLLVKHVESIKTIGHRVVRTYLPHAND